jgi:hypothetical protein
MLAQSFKSATDLQISDVELSSLITVLGMLERGELFHERNLYEEDPRGDRFNMGCTLERGACGTIGCIAGWAYVVSGKEAFPELVAQDWSSRFCNHQLITLFGIGQHTGWLARFTPEQAASVLRIYLTTGKADWNEVLA